MKVKESKNLEEIFSTALVRFENTNNAEKEQRAFAIEDMVFTNAEDGQWEEEIITKRDGRPRYTINKISPAIDQLVGDQRQNRVSIKVIAQQDATEELAKTYTGLIRSIEQQSHASDAYDNAYEECATGGFGGFKISTKFSNDDSFEQDITIEPIKSAASTLFFDCNAQNYDKSDANYAFLINNISEEEFTRKYPDASKTDFKTDNYYAGWYNSENNTVRIAEYWYKEPKKRNIGLLSNGATIDLDEEKEVLDELSLEGITVIRNRVVESYQIKRIVMSGGEILEEPKDWIGMYIPLVPVFGKTIQIENKNFIRGIVRFSKDAQRIFNYTTSSIVEITAISVKDPFFMTTKQVEGQEGQIKKSIENNSPVVLYNNEPGAVPPFRAGPAQVQPALVQQQNQADANIQATTGIEASSLGQNVGLKSGKAIQSEQAMGDRGSFVFQDNLQKSMAYGGTILVDLIPKIYDTERVVKVIGSDESIDDVTINKEIIDRQTREKVLVNDLSQGKYSVSAKSGASYATKKAESLNQLVSLTVDSPELKLLVIDLIAKNGDFNNSEELIERIRSFQIKQGAVDPTEEEKEKLGMNQPQEPDPMQTAQLENIQASTEQLRIATEKIISDTLHKDAETEKKFAETQKIMVDSFASLQKSLLDKMGAGLPITEEEQDLHAAQVAATSDSQIDYLENNEATGSNPIGPAKIGQVGMDEPLLQNQEFDQTP